MALKYRAPKGTTDLVYPESETVERLIGLAKDILELYGYKLIRTPVLENTELFTRSIGEETDIVSKEMYTFEDRGGELLTLRPEATAPVVRAYLERGLSSKGLPQKLYYYGPMFRRERPQAGRFRQFLQIGAEAIGSDDPSLDAEVVSVSDVYFRELGLKRFRLVINSVGCRECRPSYRLALTDYLKGAEKALCEQCRRRSNANPMRVFDCKEQGCIDALVKAPVISKHYCDRCSEHFKTVREGLGRLGLDFDVDERLVRGLDYYTGMTFEFQFEGLGSQNAVSAGGRFDYLVEELGGPPTPGVGFSLGVERLVMCLEAQGLQPVAQAGLDVYVAAAEGIDRMIVLDILRDLRTAGISADADYSKRSLKAQMKQADRRSARLVLIVGEEELERDCIVFRDLSRSEQREIPFSDVVSEVGDFLRSG